jgi:RNA polymerase sigma-32 factor
MTRTALQSVDLTFPVGNLESYIQRVNQIPMLTAEEEYTLATRLQEENDLQAAQRLVLSHLRFVVKVAKGYIGYGLALSDLIQEGNIGLMKAVRRFNPKMGVRLVSFAVHWIKAEIHEFILRNFRIVKVATTKAQRKLFFNLRKLKNHLGWLTQSEVAEMAKELDVKPATILEMELRLGHQNVAFDGYSDDEENQPLAPVHYLSDATQDPFHLLEVSDWEADSKQNLYEAFAKLDTRSQTILKKRWLTNKKATLQELASEFKVSAERIRQLEQQAIQKLKTYIELPNAK